MNFTGESDRGPRLLIRHIWASEKYSNKFLFTPTLLCLLRLR